MTVKPSFRELRDLGLCGLHTFENMTISLSQKRGKNQRRTLRVHETPMLELTFVTLTENLSVLTNDTKRPWNTYTTRNSCRDTLSCTMRH